MSDTLHITGILRVYEVPEELFFFRWWKHSRKKGWKYLTLEQKAREGKLVVEECNLLTSAGRTKVLSFLGASGSTTAFAQQYAVGTGTIYRVQPSDNALAGELARGQPASFSVVGNSVTISTTFSGSQANGTWTNAGLFGGTATSTLGSGTLHTHLLCSYVKSSGVTIISDYTLDAI
jgi:hypothetical protein